MTGIFLSWRGTNRPRRIPTASFLLAAALLVLAALSLGCDSASSRKAADPVPAATFADSLTEYRAAREERLRDETGWLTIAGLFWLTPGDNPFGTGPDNAVVLPTGPARAGTFVLADGAVTVRPEPGAGLLLDGAEVGERRLATDAEGEPDQLTLGRLTFWVIQRGDRLAIRLRDPESSLRVNFAGVDFYPPDPAYRVPARFHRYPEPHRVPMENMAGTVDTVIVPGEAVFSLAGEEIALLPVVDDPADSAFFFVFSDATSGDETYGGGRFLSATLGPQDRVVLDFNRAYNPPCAFNPYTTCPLPLPENRLRVSVRAGERAYAGEGH